MVINDVQIAVCEIQRTGHFSLGIHFPSHVLPHKNCFKGHRNDVRLGSCTETCKVQVVIMDNKKMFLKSQCSFLHGHASNLQLFSLLVTNSKRMSCQNVD